MQFDLILHDGKIMNGVDEFPQNFDIGIKRRRKSDSDSDSISAIGIVMIVKVLRIVIVAVI